MSDADQPTVEQDAVASNGVPPIDPAPVTAEPAQRPELLVGAAFAGGFALALMLKRLGR